MFRNILIAVGSIILVRNIAILWIEYRHRITNEEFESWMSDFQDQDPDSSPGNENGKKTVYDVCSNNQTKIYFSKIPNSGATTIQNLLSTHGYENDMLFALPKSLFLNSLRKNTPLSFPMSKPLEKEDIYPLEFQFETPEDGRPDQKFELLIHDSVLNLETVPKIFPGENSVKITMIRDPVNYLIFQIINKGKWAVDY